MTPRRLPAAAAAVTAGILLLPVPVASAQSAVTTAPSAEAWYRVLPAQAPPEADPCGLPTACLPEPPLPLPSQYAAGTLHVGVSGGAEESRTYLALDLSTIPVGATIGGGTLTLPVASDPQVGTVAPETAALRACAVSGPVQDGVDGAITPPPAVDCGTSSGAVFTAATGSAPATFTVDVGPFVAAWDSGPAVLAVVPAQDVAPSATWHVAFSRRDRAAGAAAPISAQLQVTQVSELPGSRVPDVEVRELPAGPVEVPSFGAGTSFAAPPLDAAAQQSLSAPVAPEVAAPSARVPVAALLAGPYAYPAVFLLPLLVAGAVGWAGRAMTRELAPVRA